MTHGKSEAGGAGGGNRTHTALRPPDFESGASASSATPAALGSLSRRVGRAEGRLYKIARTSRKILPQRRRGRRENTLWNVSGVGLGFGVEFGGLDDGAEDAAAADDVFAG